LAANPKRIQQIKTDYERRQRESNGCRGDGTLMETFSSDREGCIVCHL
jgi:hypothetical protein